MAGKFIELKAAAQQLGITPERLLEMSESGDVHGYRDGPSWKFKIEEIHRVAKTMSTEPAADAADDLGFSDSAALSGDDLEGLLDVSDSDEVEQGLDGSSIVIGDQGTPSSIEASGTNVSNDLKLVEEPAEPDLEDSDGASDQDLSASDSELRLADSEDLSDELVLSDDLEFDSGAALVLGEEDDLQLADSPEGAATPDSDGDVALSPLDSDSEDSAASDSGLSLDTPPDDLSASSALELPEEDEMISLDDELMAAADDATLQQDEEFLLSPSGEMLGDESSDSGSQVIALEESDAFADEAVIAEDSEEALLEPAESGELEDQIESFEGATAVEIGAVPIGATELPEAPYSVWNIVSLLLIISLLCVTGMLMTDVVRNMWSWNGSSNMTSGIADALVSILGM